MNTKNIIGAAIISIPFIAIFIIISIESGILVASIVFGVVALLVGFISLGAHLLCK